jgi:uncharacterized membrane protein
MKLKTTEFLGVMLTALVTGVFWGTWFTLTRSLEDFPPAEFIHIGKTIIANVAMPMRFIMPATLLIMLLAIWQCFRVHKTSFYLYLFSFLLMVITLIITVGIEVPIDNQIKTWTENTLPGNWQKLRQTWDSFHTLRTFTSIASLAFFSLGIINRRKIKSHY